MSPSAPAAGPVQRRRSLVAGLLVGVGTMAAVDEIVFHQLLAWHHFYDRGTNATALLSDGVLHAAQLLLLVLGLVWLADQRARTGLDSRSVWAGWVLGLGLFQLWDGIVDHKILRVHQVRFGVDLLPYDLAWNAAGLVLLLLGAVLAWRSRRGPTERRSVTERRRAGLNRPSAGRRPPSPRPSTSRTR